MLAYRVRERNKTSQTRRKKRETKRIKKMKKKKKRERERSKKQATGRWCTCSEECDARRSERKGKAVRGGTDFNVLKRNGYLLLHGQNNTKKITDDAAAVKQLLHGQNNTKIKLLFHGQNQHEQEEEDAGIRPAGRGIREQTKRKKKREKRKKKKEERKKKKEKRRKKKEERKKKKEERRKKKEERKKKKEKRRRKKEERKKEERKKGRQQVITAVVVAFALPPLRSQRNKQSRNYHSLCSLDLLEGSGLYYYKK